MINIHHLKKIIQAIEKNEDVHLSRELRKVVNHYSTSGKKYTGLMDFIAWLESSDDFPDRQQLLMLSWFLHIDTNLSADFPANAIIRLGSAYFGEPEKFAGFLYWLLERRVSPEEIVNSRLLHRYCGYNIYDVQILKNTYHWLNHQTETISHFLKYTSRKSCELRGFIDEERSHETLRSRNVKGNFFRHCGSFLFREPVWREEFDCLLFSPGFIVTLYELFGFKVIQFLGNGSIPYFLLQGELLRSQYGQQIANQIRQHEGIDSQIMTFFRRRPREENDTARIVSLWTADNRR